jgi:DNA-damage-inducible protein J
MDKASITIRLDEETKNEAESVFKEMGLSMSSAVIIFLKQCVRDGKIPFEISTDRAKKRKLKSLY